MFIVHYEGVGEGCDYTIGCNQCTIKLPKFITTMEEAIAYIQSDKQFSLEYFGMNRIEKATIYETQSFQEVNVQDIMQKQKVKKQAEQVIEKEKNELAEYERLKFKFGK